MIEIKRSVPQPAQKRAEMPVLAPGREQPINGMFDAQTAPQGTTERVRRSFTAPTDPARDYRAMYAALFRFHERNNPPTLGDDDGALYWAAVSDDLQATAQLFNGDPFMVNLLCAVFEELEREYKALRKHAAGYMPRQ